MTIPYVSKGTQQELTLNTINDVTRLTLYIPQMIRIYKNIRTFMLIMVPQKQ